MTVQETFRLRTNELVFKNYVSVKNCITPETQDDVTSSINKAVSDIKPAGGKIEWTCGPQKLKFPILVRQSTTSTWGHRFVDDVSK